MLDDTTIIHSIGNSTHKSNRNVKIYSEDSEGKSVFQKQNETVKIRITCSNVSKGNDKKSIFVFFTTSLMIGPVAILWSVFYFHSTT